MRDSTDRRIACLAVLLLCAENQINPNFLYFQATIEGIFECRSLLYIDYHIKGNERKE